MEKSNHRFECVLYASSPEKKTASVDVVRIFLFFPPDVLVSTCLSGNAAIRLPFEIALIS